MSSGTIISLSCQWLIIWFVTLHLCCNVPGRAASLWHSARSREAQRVWCCAASVRSWSRYVYWYASCRWRGASYKVVEYLDLPSAEISADGFLVGDIRRSWKFLPMGRCRKKNADTKKQNADRDEKNADAISPCIRGRCTMRVPRIKVSEDMGYKAKTLKVKNHGLPKRKTQLWSRYILCRAVKKLWNQWSGKVAERSGKVAERSGKVAETQNLFFSKPWFWVHRTEKIRKQVASQCFFLYCLIHPCLTSFQEIQG